MKQKINLLIGISAFVLIVLSAMQFYLIKTTYEYKVAQFRSEVKEKIAAVTNDYSSVDSTLFLKKDLLYKNLAQDYFKNPENRLYIKKKLLDNDFKSHLTTRLQKEFEREFSEHELDFAIVVNKFVLYDNAQKIDTVFSEKSQIQNKICGNLTTLNNAFTARTYVGTTSGTIDALPYKLLTEDTLYVSVKNWEFIILEEWPCCLYLRFFP